MIELNDYMNTIMIPYREHGGYIMGSSGQMWTAEKQAELEKTTDDRYALGRQYGRKWIGHRVWDCSGVHYFAFKQYGETIPHGSNSIWNDSCSKKGELYMGEREDGLPLRIGSATFKNRNGSRHHIGTYIGNGRVLEAKGTINGVVISKIEEWDEWGELKKVNYEGKWVEDEMGTLRAGSQGDEVRRLQTRLNALGIDCGNADGIFGNATRAAVMRFQQLNGLEVDGVVGAKTWAALDKAMPENQEKHETHEIEKSEVADLIGMLEKALEAAKRLLEVDA